MALDVNSILHVNECIPSVVKALHACVKRDMCIHNFSPLTSLLTVQLRWLLVASMAVAVRPLIRPVRDTGQALLVPWPLGESCAFLVDGYVAGGTAAELLAATSRNSSCTSTVMDTVL